MMRVVVLLLLVSWSALAEVVLHVGPDFQLNDDDDGKRVDAVVGESFLSSVIHCRGGPWAYADISWKFRLEDVAFEECAGGVMKVRGAEARANNVLFARSSSEGPAVTVSDGGYVWLSNSTFTGNAGRGIVVIGGHLKLESVILWKNSGPALWCDAGGIITSTKTTIQENVAVARPRTGSFADGGGAWIGSNCTAKFEDALFEGNEARPAGIGCDSPDAGCLSGRGGAVYLFRSTLFSCVGCTFRKNRVWAGTASRDGAQGGAIFAAFGEKVTCDHCVFDANAARGRGENRHGSPVDGGAGDGGAIKMGYFGTLILKDTTFSQNFATAGVREPARGGALSLLYVDEALTRRCQFLHNGAYGGGLVVADGLSSGGVGGAFGGAASVVACAPEFYNCLFIANSAETLGGLFAGVAATIVDAYLEPNV